MTNIAMTKPSIIQPNWPLNNIVMAGTTISDSPLAKDGFNLAQHVEDSLVHVRDNRTQLMAFFHKQVTSMWLSQTHSNKVVTADNYHFSIEADAAISNQTHMMPVVLTADCLPIVLSDEKGDYVAAIHAGWQGLYKSIIATTIANIPCAGQHLYAWIGPAISQTNYEVDEAFYQRFMSLNKDFNAFFINNRPEHYLADLISIARYQLQSCGLLSEHIYTSDICSYADKRFFSYRRDGGQSGRMATFIFPR